MFYEYLSVKILSMLNHLYSNTINSLHANESTIPKKFLGKNHFKNITTAIQKYQIWKNVEQNSFTRRVESTYDKRVDMYDQI